MSEKPNIVPLPPIKKPRADMAEGLLEMALAAERGEIDALFIIAHRPQGDFIDTYKYGLQNSRYTMLGALEAAKRFIVFDD